MHHMRATYTGPQCVLVLVPVHLTNTTPCLQLRDTVFDGKKKCGVTDCLRIVLRKFVDGQSVDKVQMAIEIMILVSIPSHSALIRF